MRSEHLFESPQALREQLCDWLTRLLQEAIESRGRALLAVSGGNTPKPLLRELSTRDLAWSKVTVTLTDERWVDNTHEASNEKMVRETLLQGPASAANFVPLKGEERTARAGERACCGRIETLELPFDVVLLGMGTDGHTASLFPETKELQAAIAGDAPACMAITPADAPYERMTLTLKTLLQSRKIILHIEGDEKYAVLQKALGDVETEQMPIRAFLRQEKVPTHIFATRNKEPQCTRS